MAVCSFGNRAILNPVNISHLNCKYPKHKNSVSLISTSKNTLMLGIKKCLTPTSELLLETLSLELALA